MSNIIFPAGFSINYPTLNMEMMQHFSKMWNLEHTKMQKGTFAGSLSMIHTPRIQFAAADYSQSFMTRGDFPPGCVVLIYTTKEDPYRFQNRLVEPYEIIMLTNGDELDVVTFGHCKTYTIVIEEELFYKEFYHFFGDTPYASLQNKKLNIKHGMMYHFHNKVNLWRKYLTNQLPKLTLTPNYHKMEATILHELFNFLSLTSPKKQRKRFQTKEIRDLLHEKISQDISIQMLTHELNISERQLYNSFKADYGISPNKYLQNLRLNAIKKELILAHHHTDTVRSIAQKYNFYHMGHFSTDYKEMFGQTPSQTLHSKI